ncbi:MAG: methionine--tRNA ligase [Polyangiaceae bacterium]|nr:methionine--tRNA ligase [Polyangiaceae bacterium]
MAFYVTTPIYYINARPHVGSAYTTIACDALARYHRLRGERVRFLTGTDEHGQKIERAAAERGVAPQVFADEVARSFVEAWPQLSISNDDFVRTTEPRHTAGVQELWRRVRDNGHITLGEYEGWYCVADEAFYTEKELVDGKSPTGRAVERVREPSYFFALSRFQERLLAFYEAHPGFVAPEHRFNEVKAFVRGGLQDLSVSRTTFTWGVKVPDDERHVVYVWFDALANYLTSLGPGEREFWPPSVHVIGKEISRFHAVYWPAFLMAAGYSDDELPRQIYVHGWLTVDGEKMSKSAGNVLDPLKIAAEVSADALRYYLLRAVSFGQDGDFSHEDLLTRINTELGNDLGNLLNRTLGLCAKNTGGLVPSRGEGGDLERALDAALVKAARDAEAALGRIEPHRALDAIFELCREANRYVDKAAPWAEAKRGDAARVGTILATLLSVCEALSVLLSPFLPEKSAEMRRQLALAPLAPREGEDHWPAAPPVRAPGATLSPGQPLFPRIDDDQRRLLLERLTPRRPAAEVAAPPAAPAPTTETNKQDISIDDFGKLDLRVGVVVSAARVPKKDKLLDLRVDLGEPEPRRIVAGLALSFTPEALVGRRVVVVANLAPREFSKGLVSHGMLLAAGPSEDLRLVAVPDGPAPGTRVK